MLLLPSQTLISLHIIKKVMMNWEGVANKMQIFFAFNIFRVVQVSSSLLVCASGLH